MARQSRFHPISIAVARQQPPSIAAVNGANRTSLLPNRLEPERFGLGKPLPGGFRYRLCHEGFQPLAAHSLSQAQQLLVPVNAFPMIYRIHYMNVCYLVKGAKVECVEVQ
jgi:hypothetical protein